MKWWKWDLKLFIVYKYKNYIYIVYSNYIVYNLRIIQEEKDFEEFLRFLIYFLENLKFRKPMEW